MPQPKSPLTDAMRWDAVRRCDTGADGQFVYAVVTTGICCRPSCRAKKPLRKNIRFFDTARQAVAAGFRPCKRCRPDLAAFSPDRQLIDDARAAMAQSPARTISDIAAEIGCTTSTLNRVFRRELGQSPAALQRSLRVDLALSLMDSRPQMPIPELALAAGFGSLSAFYRAFRAQTGRSAGQYRAEKE